MTQPAKQPMTKEQFEQLPAEKQIGLLKNLPQEKAQRIFGKLPEGRQQEILALMNAQAPQPTLDAGDVRLPEDPGKFAKSAVDLGWKATKATGKGLLYVAMHPFQAINIAGGFLATAAVIILVAKGCMGSDNSALHDDLSYGASTAKEKTTQAPNYDTDFSKGATAPNKAQEALPEGIAALVDAKHTQDVLAQEKALNPVLPQVPLELNVVPVAPPVEIKQSLVAPEGGETIAAQLKYFNGSASYGGTLVAVGGGDKDPYIDQLLSTGVKLRYPLEGVALPKDLQTKDGLPDLDKLQGLVDKGAKIHMNYRNNDKGRMTVQEQTITR